MAIIDSTIIALDNMTKEDIDNFFFKNPGTFKYAKIGLELFNRYGHDIVHHVSQEHNLEIFLDLKLHDIPKTVYKAIKSLEGLKVKFLTVHLSGGREMLKEAMKAASESLPGCTLLGVSVLTSLDNHDMKELCRAADTKEQCDRLFKLALDVNFPGLILSPLELNQICALEKEMNKSIVKITPGIRFQDEIDAGNTQDQKRIMSPEKAIESGAEFLVIGRSLTQASDLDSRIKQLS